ncbi:MAG: Rieske 2Fe-2S domain-containing protein [Candidatus Hodgkinia cicadicola]
MRDKLARNENIDKLALASDVNRCTDKQSQNWLVLLAPCTHLSCILEAKSYGWYCACHGSVYDLASRVVRGPASTNLPAPHVVLPLLLISCRSTASSKRSKLRAVN